MAVILDERELRECNGFPTSLILMSFMRNYIATIKIKNNLIHLLLAIISLVDKIDYINISSSSISSNFTRIMLPLMLFRPE
jgi:hypothetical protein